MFLTAVLERRQADIPLRSLVTQASQSNQHSQSRSSRASERPYLIKLEKPHLRKDLSYACTSMCVHTHPYTHINYGLRSERSSISSDLID